MAGFPKVNSRGDELAPIELDDGALVQDAPMSATVNVAALRCTRQPGKFIVPIVFAGELNSPYHKYMFLVMGQAYAQDILDWISQTGNEDCTPGTTLSRADASATLPGQVRGGRSSAIPNRGRSGGPGSATRPRVSGFFAVSPLLSTF